MRGRFERALASIERGVRSLPLDASAPGLALDEFHELFATSLWAAHRMGQAPDGSGLVPAFFEHRGWNDVDLRRYREALARPAGPTALLYDPDRPDETQRNRVFVLRELYRTIGAEAADRTHRLLRSVGLDTQDQLRVVVCDGPLLLGWIGGFRDTPFTVREKRGLERLVPALRAALLWRRRLDEAGLMRAGLVASMEAIGCPAFLVSKTGSLAHANTLGSEMAAEQARGLAAGLHEAVVANRAESIAVRAPGLPEHELVLLRDESSRSRQSVARAAEAWSLTRRQSEVLALVASGESNKGVAAKLGCAEVTVEFHVTALLRKAGAATRAELTARVWGADRRRG